MATSEEIENPDIQGNEKGQNMKHLKEQIMKVIFFIAACTSVLAVALICIFLFANGLPAMEKIGLGKFLTGVIWKPSNNIFGILPMIMGSIYVTAG